MNRQEPNAEAVDQIVRRYTPRAQTITVDKAQYFKNLKKFLTDMVTLYAPNDKGVSCSASPYPWTAVDVRAAIQVLSEREEANPVLVVDVPVEAPPAAAPSSVVQRAQHIESLRDALSMAMGKLLSEYELGSMAAVDYVDRVNWLIRDTFACIKKALGPDEYADLYGGPLPLLDLAMFIGSEKALEVERNRYDPRDVIGGGYASGGALP